MYDFRPFLNSDPPRLAQIWRCQPPQRGVMQPISAGLLEQFVLSKQYFDYEGLIVATQGGTPVGFAHASFGPDEQQAALSTDLGTTQILMLDSDHRDPALADELLSRSEAYLRDRGAKVLYAGGIRPLNAFYLGLYGGSELPGILATDPIFPETCRRNGYREIDRALVLQRELGRFRMPVSRELRRLRRELRCREITHPRPTTWWETCTIGAFERLHFQLERNASAEPVADVWFWDIEPLSTSWGVPTCGMYDLEVVPNERRKHLATYILSDAFDRLRKRGIVLVEALTMRDNTPALVLYEKLGFVQVDQGFVFRKE